MYKQSGLYPTNFCQWAFNLLFTTYNEEKKRERQVTNVDVFKLIYLANLEEHKVSYSCKALVI